VKPSLSEGLSPCSSTASEKIVSTIKKLIKTEKNEVNLRAVSVRASDMGKVNNYTRLLSIKLTAKITAQNICPCCVSLHHDGSSLPVALWIAYGKNDLNLTRLVFAFDLLVRNRRW
jgi:predicted adenine nucleotide alpha hydrolase (AANH) superfamily ATPase